MIDDIKKSLNTIFTERVSSPLYGTVVVSWMLWNWKIIYLTIFISRKKIDGNKIDYILTNFSDPHHLITYPLISALIFLTIIPFVANGTYWLSLIFQSWRVNKKNEVEKKQLLSLEQSINLRSEMQNMEVEFGKILEKKENEISSLKLNLSELQKKTDETEQTSDKFRKSNRNGIGSSSYGSNDFKEFMENKRISSGFENIAQEIRNNGQFPDKTPETTKEYYLVNDIVLEKMNSAAKPYYELSFKGKGLYRDYFNHNFEKEI